MSLSLFTFLRLFCCVYLVTSAAHAQSGVWNDHKLKMEFMKMDSKISYFEEKMDELTVNNTNLVEELKRSKERENELRNEIDSIGKLSADAKGKIETLEKSKQEVDTCCAKQVELMREMKLMMFEIKELKVEIKELNFEMKKSNERGELLNKELREVKRKDKRLELGVTEPYNYHLWNEYYKEEPDFSWVIDDWKSQMNRKPSEVLSPVFPLKGYSFGAKANLTRKDDDYLYVSLSFKDINESGSALNLKLVPAVYFTFKYQNTNQPLVQVIRSENYLFTAKLNYDRLYYERRLIKFSKVTNNTITINVHVEPPSIAERGVSHNGKLTWAIDDFWKKRTMENENLVQLQRSPYFYSNPKGYKVEANVRLNGEKDYKGIGLSIKTVFLTGPYDTSLTTFFKYRTTVTLLHPTDPNKHITKSMESDLKNEQKWTIDMATNEEVEKLLHEDTLYYKVQMVAI